LIDYVDIVFRGSTTIVDLILTFGCLSDSLWFVVYIKNIELSRCFIPFKWIPCEALYWISIYGFWSVL